MFVTIKKGCPKKCCPSPHQIAFQRQKQLLGQPFLTVTNIFKFSNFISSGIRSIEENLSVREKEKKNKKREKERKMAVALRPFLLRKRAIIIK